MKTLVLFHYVLVNILHSELICLYLFNFSAHPNVKLFISQGGLQSFQEAVYHGVPLIGIPFFADQQYNTKKIHETGIGLQLMFNKITKEMLSKSINEILHNSR